MEATEELITMLNQMPSPAFFVKDGVVTHVNSGAQAFTITPGTPIGELLATGQPEYGEFNDGYLYLTLNIHGRAVAVCVTPINDCHYFVFEEDEDAAELQSMAVAAQALRNPLANVMTIADRLFPLTDLRNIPGAEAQLAQINRGLFQMLRMVSNMSDAYRYCSSTTPCMETREVGGILEELFSKTAALIQHTGVELNFTNLRESVFSLVDAQMLERAVHNILSNALKFSPKGSTIDARLVRRGEMLCLTVSNSQSSDDFWNNIYRQYQRTPGLEDNRFGIGLGMVLIRSAATAHGGTVLLQKLPKQGTQITMTMSIRKNPQATVRNPILFADYAGERDHALLELSDSLPYELYIPETIN